MDDDRADILDIKGDAECGDGDGILVSVRDCHDGLFFSGPPDADLEVLPAIGTAYDAIEDIDFFGLVRGGAL